MKKLFLAFVALSILYSVFSLPAFAQTAPSAPADVAVSYPSCDGPTCSFVNAKCTWGAATGAASYTIKVTEVETSTVVKTESLASSVLTYTFPVTAGKTYKCDVNAVNASGTAGAVGTDSLLCQTDATAPAPTSAPTPTITPIPTKPLLPTATPPPPVAGNELPLALAAVLGIGALIFGGLLFKL